MWSGCGAALRATSESEIRRSATYRHPFSNLPAQILMNLGRDGHCVRVVQGRTRFNAVHALQRAVRTPLTSDTGRCPVLRWRPPAAAQSDGFCMTLAASKYCRQIYRGCLTHTRKLHGSNQLVLQNGDRPTGAGFSRSRRAIESGPPQHDAVGAPRQCLENVAATLCTAR